MNQSLTIGKRALTIAVAAATILWSVGFSAFVAPLTARAASAGDVIRGTTLSTVYYYGADGQRYAFPNEKTYFTWYEDFSGVQTITDSELADIPLAGNVVYRPGSRWIKIQSDPKTYAVTPEGVIRWIETEAVAEGLAGSAWNTFIDDVPDVFFVDYTVGASLTDASAGYDGMLVEGSTYLLWGGEKRLVTDAGMSANRLQSRFVLPGTGVGLSGITAGADLTGAESAYTDTAQLPAGTVAPTGGLSLSLASDTPGSATLPRGAASVSMLKVKMQATSGSASVSQMVFKLGGIGAVGNLPNNYFYQGNKRLTDSRSINTSTREVTFSALGISLASGEAQYGNVRSDVAAAAVAADTANFQLVSADKVASTATVSGDFPIVGNTMTFSGTSAGTIDINARGTITDPTIGQDDAVIGKFRAQIANEDGYLHQITLNVDDAKDHSDYKLWKSGALVTECSSDGKDLVTCAPATPEFLEEGRSSNYDLSADIGGDSVDAVRVAVEENADVIAVGTDFGFNLAVDITDYDEEEGACVTAADDCSFSNVQGGELTFAFNGPPSGDIQVDGDDEVLMNFTLTADDPVELQQIDVIFACVTGADCDDDDADDGGLVEDAAAANLEGLTIRNSDGSTFMGPEELTVSINQDDTQTLNFTDVQNLGLGTSLDLMITVDVRNQNNATFVGNEFRATLYMAGVQAEDANGDDLAAADIIPTSDIVGNLFTVREGTLNINASSPPSSGQFVRGAQNVDVVGHTFEAGNTSAVTVTDLTMDVVAEGDDSFTAVDSALIAGVIQSAINSCSLYDSQTGSLVDGPEGITATPEVVHESFTWSVPAGETGKLLERCNFANVAPQGGNDDAFLFFIQNAAAVTAQDKNGDDVTPTVASNPQTAAGVAISIANAGTLAVTLDGSSPNASIILGSSTGVVTSVFKVQSTNENFLITDLTFVNCVAYTGDNDCNDGGEADGADAISSAAMVSYKNQAGDTVTKTGFLSGNRLDLSSLDFYAPTTSTRTVSVSVDTNNVSSTGATSGNQLQLNMVDSGAVATQFTRASAATFIPDFKAVGQSSGQTVTDFVGVADATPEGIAARAMTVRKTKPTISLASGSPSGAAVPGLGEVLRFTVAADSRGFIEFNAITFDVTATDNANSNWNICTNFGLASKWEFYDLDDPSTKLDDNGDWFFLDETLVDRVCSVGLTNNVEVAILDLGDDATTPVEEIGAGSTKTYVVKVDTTGASSASDDSFRLDIMDQTTADGLTELCGVGECPSFSTADDPDAISWDDDTEAQVVDGNLIKNLPISGGTLVF